MSVRVFFTSAISLLLAMYVYCGSAVCQEKTKTYQEVSPPQDKKAKPDNSIRPELKDIPWDTGGNDKVVKPESTDESGAMGKAEKTKELLQMDVKKTETGPLILQKPEDINGMAP